MSRFALKEHGQGLRRKLDFALCADSWPTCDAPVTALEYSAQRFPLPVGLDRCRQGDLRERLRLLCGRLDDCLDRPARIRRLGTLGRRIVVFGKLTYDVRTRERCITTGRLRNGKHFTEDGVFEVNRPLSSSRWLWPVIAGLGLADDRQTDLLLNDREGAAVRWLADAAHRLLLRRPDFQHFRKVVLPEMFAVPQDIRWIAMASRIGPVGPLLDSRTLNYAWSNERAFRQVAQENPQLLPLLLALVEHIPPGASLQAKDPVRALKDAFLEAGLKDSAWRYVACHGARIFQLPWRIAVGQPSLEVAFRYLTALQAAGLPPPPPPSLVRVLLHGFNAHHGSRARIGNQFHCGIDPVVLSKGLAEADRRRQQGSVAGFAEEFLGVCWWAERALVFLDDTLAGAGWSAYVRHWRAAEAEAAQLDEVEPAQWKNRLGIVATDRRIALPVESARDLVREGRTMRNCLASCLDDCKAGHLEIYSVRDAATGRRKACIGIRYDREPAALFDVKGYANTPPDADTLALARRMLDLGGWETEND